MAESIKAPRGVRDILPEDSWKWGHVLAVTQKMAELYAYREIHLPVFEHTELFARGIGEATDVVEKEMYTFTDKGGRSITLRPELTASMVRSYLEHSMSGGRQPVKLWGVGPMFRYERPQKGRYRQFWQLDFESLGSENALVDVDTIMTAVELFRTLGMSNLEVVLNSVGCPVCRPAYRKTLTEFIGDHRGDLCPTCENRFNRNPLRILDCKDEKCKRITDEAPAIFESLCESCSRHFEAVTSGLDDLGVAYHIDKRLVRGLDYYTKTAFEVQSGDLGAQNAVCGGGRYDNLAEAIGGPHVPGVGFAAGLDRIVLTMEQQNCSFGREPMPQAYVICADETARPEALELLYALRRAGVSADMDYMGKSLKAQFKAAGSGSSVACVFGGNEVSKGIVTLKNLMTSEQIEAPRDQAVAQVMAVIDR
ncbi:MAG: histidine--tRNA ligase [Dethiosulfovibrio peptidovorans]|nr:MAG: histidine--tRNA ligase [Dethiosulfovibrio peptidovorans]